jgi:hypothetical protein
VLVRVARSSRGDYRTPPTVRVAEVACGDREQASKRETRRASTILNALMAAAVSAAILTSLWSIDTAVHIGYADKIVQTRHELQRHGGRVPQ